MSEASGAHQMAHGTLVRDVIGLDKREERKKHSWLVMFWQYLAQWTLGFLRIHILYVQ